MKRTAVILGKYLAMLSIAVCATVAQSNGQAAQQPFVGVQAARRGADADNQGHVAGLGRCGWNGRTFRGARGASLSGLGRWRLSALARGFFDADQARHRIEIPDGCQDCIHAMLISLPLACNRIQDKRQPAEARPRRQVRRAPTRASPQALASFPAHVLSPFSPTEGQS